MHPVCPRVDPLLFCVINDVRYFVLQAGQLLSYTDETAFKLAAAPVITISLADQTLTVERAANSTSAPGFSVITQDQVRPVGGALLRGQ